MTEDSKIAGTTLEEASQASSRIIKCPNCGKPTPYSSANAHRPFCSKICQTGDLAAWATDEYVVPGTQLTQNEIGDPEESPDLLN